VSTLDGYILGIHRIPGSNSEETLENPKPVALLGHGMLSSRFLLNILISQGQIEVLGIKSKISEGKHQKQLKSVKHIGCRITN
jgi:hypothetical protein